VPVALQILGVGAQFRGTLHKLEKLNGPLELKSQPLTPFMVAVRHAVVLLQVRACGYVKLEETFTLELVAAKGPVDPETLETPLHAGVNVIV
jgi:hypothetical protein